MKTETPTSSGKSCPVCGTGGMYYYRAANYYRCHVTACGGTLPGGDQAAELSDTRQCVHELAEKTVRLETENARLRQQVGEIAGARDQAVENWQLARTEIVALRAQVGKLNQTMLGLIALCDSLRKHYHIALAPEDAQLVDQARAALAETE